MRQVSTSLAPGLTPGRLCWWGGQGSSRFLLKPSPLAQEDPTEQGQKSGLYPQSSNEPPWALRKPVPLPPAGNNEDELVIFLNGHIFWLTQTLLELVLVGTK